MIRYMVIEIDLRDPQQPRPIIWAFDYEEIKEAEQDRASVIKKYHTKPDNISVVQYRI